MRQFASVAVLLFGLLWPADRCASSPGMSLAGSSLFAAAPNSIRSSGTKSAAPVVGGFGVRDGPARSKTPPQPVRPQPPQSMQQPALRDDSRPARHSGRDSDHDHHHHRHPSGSGRGWCGWNTSAWGWPGVYGGWYLPAFGVAYPGVALLPGAALFDAGPLVAPPAAEAAEAAVVPAPAVDPAEPAGQPNATHPEQKAKAGRFLAFGDTNFASQKYLAALERYKTAAQMAPDMGEPYFRQGHAQVALGQFANAIKAFRRGLRLEGDWAASPFRLDQLYRGDKATKTRHLENLATTVEANPFSSDLMALLGLELYFDGQQDRAMPFLERASQLGGNEDRLLDDFLPRPAPAGEPQPPRGPGQPAAGAAPAAGAKIVF